MLHGFMKSKFHSKCKSATKQMKSRIEIIRRKRNAMQKYLKNDIADLLKNGLDINAYGRAEGLQVELILSSCYDFLEQFGECIASHVSVMDRQRECPEQCREAVSSLMFAAARFADLPELRQLRSIFTDRYGNSLESYVNQEFVEKLNPKPPTKEMKLQLMQNIALEFGIEWNSKALEQKLYAPPAPEKDWSKNADDNKHKEHKSRDDFRIGDNQGAEYKHGDVREYTASKWNKEDQSSYGRIEVNNEETKQSNNGERTPPTRDTEEANTNQNEQKSASNVTAPKEEVEVKIPFYQRLIPPYIRPKVSKTETTSDVPPTGSGRDDVAVDANPKPKSVRRTRLKHPPSNDYNSNVGGDGQGKMNSNGTDKQDAKQVEGPLKLPPARQVALGVSNNTRNKSKDGPHSQATSSPSEPTSPTESPKGPAQASSFEPDMLNQTGPTQPKLPPDYDDLLVRLAALRGK